MKKFYIYLVFHLVCGVLAYGIIFADLQRRLPKRGPDYYRRDLSYSVYIGILGPIGLTVSLIVSGFAEHGLKFR